MEQVCDQFFGYRLSLQRTLLNENTKITKTNSANRLDTALLAEHSRQDPDKIRIHRREIME
jgi:hypothetical protein